MKQVLSAILQGVCVCVGGVPMTKCSHTRTTEGPYGFAQEWP